MNRLPLLLAAFLLLASCVKEEENVVPGKEIAPDPTISLVAQESYANRAYISLLGRKPDSSEKQAAMKLFETDECGPESRAAFVEGLMADEAFYWHVYKMMRRDLLEELDTATIRRDLERAREDLEERQDPPDWLIEREAQLTRLDELPNRLIRGRITLAKAQARCVDSPYYHDINMGTENFVVSMFSNFFARYPSMHELESGKDMVDGDQAALFGQTGRTYERFIEIFLASDEYYEGQIRALYRRFMLREPTPAELAAEQPVYQADNDFVSLYKRLLTSDAYVRGQ